MAPKPFSPALTVELSASPHLKQYKKRPYAHACSACKSRKIKCEDADDPPCKGCRASSLICQFPDRSVRRKRNAPPSLPPEALPRGLEGRLRRIERALDLHSPVLSDKSESEDEIAPPRFQLGGSDHPVYHGETSMHEDIASPSKLVGPSPLTLDVSGWSDQNLRELTKLRHKYASPEEGEAWMNAYFTWASVTYAVVNRSIFLRDMALEGPYFSHLLLLSFYLSGLRFSPNMSQQEREERSTRYMKIVMTMIMEELSKPCSIPTAQALLTLAGRSCSVGNQTQAWLFTGLAIRMIQDLGIHLAIDDPSLDAHLPQDVKELRVRLYWSAYCWDKTISLGMGREPALICRRDSFPEVKLNDSDDEWEWFPVFHGRKTMSYYPRTTAKTTFCLRYSSQLYMILESILANMYSPQRPNARSVSFIRATDEQLKTWRSNLPDVLKLDATNLPQMSPPTNVTTLNLLYNLVWILLYRPLLTVRNHPSAVNSAFRICRSAAIDIHEILSLWGRTWGNVNLVYLAMYTTFVAAGVDVILLRIGDAQMKDEALKRVHLSLSILEQASDQGPGIRRGISIIASQLQAATLRPNGPSTVAPGLFRAESSMRTEQPAPEPTAPSSLSSYLMNDVSTDPASSLDFPTLFDDPSNQQTLADLLGESNIGTDDPFAFLSGEGWDESAF